MGWKKMTPLLWETARQWAIHGNRKDVARAMGCSPGTIRRRIEGIRSTTGAQTMTEWYRDVGWLKVPEVK
jgi:hypothetical protein